MSGSVDDPYEILGIARNATPAEVKQAYFRLVRVHTPEDDAERFQEISEAYRVLSNPEARRRLDAEERLPAEAAEIIRRALELTATDGAKAVAMAKRLLAGGGTPPVVRFAVAGVCMHAGRPADAIPILERLVRDDAARPEYLGVLGDAYLGCRRLDDAERALKSVVALAPKWRRAYASLADFSMERGHAPEALRILDRGIQANGVAGLEEVPLQLRKIGVLARDGRWKELSRVVTAIQSSIPVGDADAARHVASQFWEMAKDAIDARAYDIAKFAVDAAHGIDPAPWLAERSAELEPFARSARDCRAAHADARVADWIRTLLPGHFSPLRHPDEWQRVCAAAIDRIHSRGAQADSEWNWFRTTYPAAAESIEKTWIELRTAARATVPGRPQTAGGGTRRERAAAGSGGGRAGGIAVFVILSLVLSTIVRTCDRPARKPLPPVQLKYFDAGPATPEATRRRLESIEKDLEAARRNRPARVREGSK